LQKFGSNQEFFLNPAVEDWNNQQQVQQAAENWGKLTQKKKVLTFWRSALAQYATTLQ